MVDVENIDKEIQELEAQARKDKFIRNKISDAQQNPLKFLDYFTSTRIKSKSRKKEKSIALQLINNFLSKPPDTFIMDKNNRPLFDAAQLLKCKSLILNGFNVLIYGIGSKLELLRTLSEEYLSPIGDIIFINGGTGNISVKTIFEMVITLIHRKLPNEAKKYPSSFSEQAIWIKQKMTLIKEPDLQIILVIHCFDAVYGVNNNTLNALCKLVEIEHIRVLVSIENTRAFILWSADSLSSFEFIHLQLDTYLPYTKKENYFTAQYIAKEEAKERELTLILKSLSTNQKYLTM